MIFLHDFIDQVALKWYNEKIFVFTYASNTYLRLEQYLDNKQTVLLSIFLIWQAFSFNFSRLLYNPRPTMFIPMCLAVIRALK